MSITARAEGVYCTLNPVHPDLLARCANRVTVAGNGQSAADIDIVARRWLLIDIDPVRRPKISASDPEKRAARDVADAVAAYLAKRGWPRPMLVDSGNGFHLYYRIDLPTDDGGVVKACLSALGNKFDTDEAKVDQSVFNPSRIVKLAGTLARKGDSIPDRPHRRATILHRPDEFAAVPRDLLHALAAEAPKPAPRVVSKNEGQASRRSGRGRTSVAERARRYIATMDVAIEGQHGSDEAFHVACILTQGFGLSVEESLPLMTEWNTGCQPPWSEAEMLHKLRDADAKDDPRGRGYKLRESQSNGTPHSGVRTFDADDEQQDGPSDDLDPSDQQNRCDLANARRFARRHGSKFRHVVPWSKWLAWDGTRWRLDDSLAVQQAYRSVVDELFERAAEKQNSDVWKFACDSANSRDINAALALARSEDGIPILPSTLDSDPWLLNCRNGTVNLRTGELRPHRQADFLTTLAPTRYAPDAPSYAWDRFLASTFGGAGRAIAS